MKRTALCILLLRSGVGLSADAAVTLRCDFSNGENQRDPMRYHWNVSNRISPMRSFNMPVGENPYICVVRPLGGKSRNDQKLINEDTYKWNGENYYYDWEPLKRQINTVQSRARIFQLMIDNVPWAFQRGIDMKGGKEVETYGNAYPPNDPEAWAVYIQEMLQELIKTYGREQVAQWRYCIGREIGTAGHWRGTKVEFFEHYATTVKAIHSVLPEAKVGSHFLWASSNNSYGPDFVRWCKANGVHYDFVGVSYYPFYNKVRRVDIEYVYQADFAPIKDIPEWNPAASLEIHEFSLIKSMSKRGNSFDNAPKAHTEAFTVMLGKMMNDHDMNHVFRWGTGEGKLAEQEFQALEGDYYYTGSKEGVPLVDGNMIDAVFARDMKKNRFNVMVYNYNGDPSFRKDESVDLDIVLPVPPSTSVKYRTAVLNDEALEWSDWKMKRTKMVEGREKSHSQWELDLASFSFQRLEIEGPTLGRTKRALTKRTDGSTVEVELGGLKEGNLLCFVKGRRYIIPVDSLSDEDQLFLEQWAGDQ